MAGMEAYCVKCKQKREITDPEEVTLKNGRRAAQGKCAVCGTKLFRMLGAEDKADGAENGKKAKASAKS